MNPRLGALNPYPFERLRSLLEGVVPASLPPVRLSIGEPQHPTPAFIQEAFVRHLDGLSTYPLTIGTPRLREAIARWFVQRYRLTGLDPSTQVLPVNGSREALFAFAQCVVDGSRPGALVACPNPFYQIYEGAALLAGAQPAFLNQTPENEFGLDLDGLSEAEWKSVQLAFVCSPGNPTGRVLTLDEWRALFDAADRYDFVIAADECYSEIYTNEASPPLGGLEAARALGRHDYRRLVVFTSLSKRSNVPGLRSGAVAGDGELLRGFLAYRTYHGCAMSPTVQEASIAAWSDEAHVVESRAQYREKFRAVVPILSTHVRVSVPDAGFYLWPEIPAAWRTNDAGFTRDLVASGNVTVLPGSYLARTARGVNPGAGRVRMALVAPLDACVDAARRVVRCCECRPSTRNL